MLDEFMLFAHEMRAGSRIEETQEGRGVKTERVHTGARWLTVLGTNGSGKTHLFWCLNALRKKLHWGGGVLRWVDVENRMRGGEPRFLENIIDDDLVLVDDIFAGKDTEFTVAKLYELMNARLGRWTVFNCNLGLGAIAGIEKKIASRLVRDANRVVELDAGIVDYALRGTGIE